MKWHLLPWLEFLWRRAQGLNFYRWEARGDVPHRCIVCDRPWRPDQPEYIAVYGYVSYWSETGFLWSSDTLGLYALPVEDANAYIQYICRDHGDRWSTIPDCRTGTMIALRQPPSTLERDWTTACYWTGTVLRFAFILTQQLCQIVRNRITGEIPIAERAAWPPIRVRS